MQLEKVLHMFPLPFALYTDFEFFITPSAEHAQWLLLFASIKIS